MSLERDLEAIKSNLGIANKTYEDGDNPTVCIFCSLWTFCRNSVACLGGILDTYSTYLPSQAEGKEENDL